LRIISCALQVRTTGVAFARLYRPWSVAAHVEFEPDGRGMSRGFGIFKLWDADEFVRNLAMRRVKPVAA
jgi:hypothetical protein